MLTFCRTRNDKMKYFFRYLRNNPFYAVINIAGLAVSLMFVILLGDYSYRQFSIDRWHHKRDRIQALSVTGGHLATWPDATHALRERYPEIESVCCLNMHKARIKTEDGLFSGSSGGEGEGNVMVADSTFFRFFDFKFVDGDGSTALDSPEKCVITESLARKLFPDRNPLGQPLGIVGSRYVRVNDGTGDPYDSTLVYTVSAVIRDFDRTVLLNTTELIASSERCPQIIGYRVSGGTYVSGPLGSTYSFLMTAPGASLEDKTGEMAEFFKEQIPALRFYGAEPQPVLIPLDELMFAPQNSGGGILKGDRGLLEVLLAAVLAILLFAVTNYVNLTTANTGLRAKEVATRRLLGSDARGVSLELIAESTLMVFVSFLIGFALALYFEEGFETLFRGKIDLLRDLSFGTVGACILFIILTGVISGIIPTMMLLKFKPIDIVKGSFRLRSKMVFSKVFIIVQNIITVTMLTSTFTIFLQINHLINAPLGHDVENLYVVSADEGERMRSELDSQPYIKAIGTFRGSSLDGNGTNMTYKKDRNMDNVLVYMFDCDSTYLEISGLKVLKDCHLAGDVHYVNESLAAKVGLGEEDTEIVWGDGSTTQVAGIFSNYRMINVTDPYREVMMTLLPTEQIGEYQQYLVLTDGSREAYRKLCELVQEVDGTSEDLEWKVRDLEKGVAESFESERSTMRLISMFTLIAVLISALGFIGMSLFFIRQRRKEIGVRRIMGSTVGEILTLLLRKFCAPLLISFVVAVPLSYFLMRGYLEDFSYRIGLSPLIFLAAAATSLLIAVLSVLPQALHASRTNPADSVRTE